MSACLQRGCLRPNRLLWHAVPWHRAEVSPRIESRHDGRRVRMRHCPHRRATQCVPSPAASVSRPWARNGAAIQDPIVAWSEPMPKRLIAPANSSAIVMAHVQLLPLAQPTSEYAVTYPFSLRPRYGTPCGTVPRVCSLRALFSVHPEGTVSSRIDGLVSKQNGITAHEPGGLVKSDRGFSGWARRQVQAPHPQRLRSGNHRGQ